MRIEGTRNRMHGRILFDSRTRAAMSIGRAQRIEVMTRARDARCGKKPPMGPQQRGRRGDLFGGFSNGVSRGESGYRTYHGGGRPGSSATLSGTLPGHWLVAVQQLLDMIGVPKGFGTPCYRLKGDK